MAIKVEYAARESFTNMRRNFFMTIAAVLVVSISLFLGGAAVLLRQATGRTADLLTRQVRVTVFLDGDISPDQRAQLEGELENMPEVSEVIYESKPEAYARFRRLFADQPAMVRNTSPNALPESFRIKLKDPEKFTVIRDRLTGRPTIENIRDERKTVRQLFSVTSAIRTAGLVVAIVVSLAALILIATTIRMAIYARRKEIGIMKLVGATNWFIRVPFMLEGVVQGLIGAVIAVLLLVAVKPALSSFGVAPGGTLSRLNFQVTYGDILVHGSYLALAGVVVGAVGSLFGLRRFLDV